MVHNDRVVVLIDMDCFYCQVEEKLNPALKDKPIAVVQYNAWRGGGIIAVNYPARDQGVTRYMRGNDAKKKCPSINLVKVPEVRGKADLTKYRDAGKDVADVLATFTPLLQRASVDEAYLDITELVEKRVTDLNDLNADNLANTFVVGADLKDFLHNVKINKEFSMENLKLALGGLITEQIRNEVFKKTGYKCSAGIAHNKILAKLVCSLHKPNKQTILPQDSVETFFESIPIKKITSLGGKFGQTLSDDFQITYMSQLAKIPEKQLAQKYDEKTANWLFNIARGIDTEPVTTKLISKSIGCCKNFPGASALTTLENVEHWLHELSEEMAERLEKDLKENRRKAKHIVVNFSQEIDKKDVSSSRTHPLVSYEAKKIAEAALDVINRFCLRSDGSYHLKFLGLSAGHFEDVKNVREITTFFQVGQNKNNGQNKNEHLNKNVDENPGIFRCPDENVYCQLTQELEENSQELIFYDDIYRIKETVNSQIHCKSETCDNDTGSKILVQDTPSTSFFARFFDNNPARPPSDVVEQEEKNDESDFEEPGTLCNECNQIIPSNEIVSHQDYHFALKLSKEQNILEKSVKVNTAGNKGKKRKVDNNSTINAFFKKDKEDLTAITEICPQCNRKIRIDEIESHMDYHTAKKIHLEINAIVKPSGVNNVSKKKVNTSKECNNHTSNRSIISFFKPQ